MRRTEVYIYYNDQKGYIFASDTIFLGKVTHTTVNPILILSKESATDAIIGEYVRKALDISRNAEPVDKDSEGIYKFWEEIGIKRYGTFSKKFKCIEIEEFNNALYYRKFIGTPRGGYIGEYQEKDRKHVDINVSDKELGALVKKEVSI